RPRVLLLGMRALQPAWDLKQAPSPLWPECHQSRPPCGKSCRGTNRNRPFRHKPWHNQDLTPRPWRTSAAPAGDSVSSVGAESPGLSSNKYKPQYFPSAPARSTSSPAATTSPLTVLQSHG